MQRWLLDVVAAHACHDPPLVVYGDDGDPAALRAAGAAAALGLAGFRDRAAAEPDALAREVADLAAAHRAGRVHLAQAGLGFLARPLSARGAEVLLTVHGNDLTRPWLGPGRDARTRARRVRTHLGDADCVLAVSRFSAERAREAGARRCVVVPPAVDAARWTPGDRAAARRRLGLPAARPVLLSVGRLVERKGFRDVAAALARVPGDPLWVVAGGERPGSPLRRHLAAAAGSPAGERIRLLGPVPDATLLDLYRAADLFVLAPYEDASPGGRDVEGFGIVFLEAAACGLAALATRSGGVPDAVADGETGLLVAPRDPAALARAVGALLADAPRRRRLGEAGRDRVRRDFSRARLAERLRRAGAGG